MGAALALWALGQATVSPALGAFAVEISPPDRLGQAQALHRQAGDVTMLLGPVVLGLVAEAIGSHSQAIAAYTLFGAAAAAAAGARLYAARRQAGQRPK